MAMTHEEKLFVAAARRLEEIAAHPGLQVFIDAIKDFFDPEDLFTVAEVKQGWTLGEEFAYKKGQRDAIAFIVGEPARGFDGIREKVLKKAQDLIDQEREEQTQSSEV